METNNSNTFATDLTPRSVPDVVAIGSDGVRREGAAVSGLSTNSGGLNAGTSTATATATVVVTTQQQQQQPEHNINDDVPILRLSLRPRSHVTWDERVVNNEGMGRKSSKRCCIFHKQRAFGESSTESSGEEDDDGSTSSSSSGGWGSGSARPMARKKNKGKKKMGVVKNKPKIPDYQRFHA